MKNIAIVTTVLFLTIVASTSIQAGEYVNHCHDKESWKEWNDLVHKHPHDMDIQMLHAVRIGFCQKVEKESITMEMAVDLFDQLHKVVYEKAKKEKEQWLKSKQL